jgi:AraC-like DNA-binding protein
LVVRLSDDPLRVYDRIDDAVGRSFPHAVVGGARASVYLCDASAPVASVGAVLRPGASEALFGVAADELAERHTPLSDLWGAAASREVNDRLLAAPNLAQQLARFEALLFARVRRVRGLHPALARALERFRVTSDVGAVVSESGLSHRHFVALFRRAVGLSPKLHCRVQRFAAVVDRLAASPGAWPSLADLSLDHGYSDQSHLTREFRALAGLSPGRFRALSPAASRHVPVPRAA